ncbi:MAG: hypothetical protein EXS13_07815 [Planctomycetes bacterium]|nr:hypothetical protein [Planctomycetota bacterium]
MAALNKAARVAQAERKFAVGASTSRALKTWITTLPQSVLLAVIALLPSFVWMQLSGGYDADAPARTMFEKIIDQLIDSACSGVLSGMVIYVAFKRLMREPAALGTAISTGMRRFVPLLVTGLITAALVVLPLVAMFVLSQGANSDLKTSLLLMVGVVAGIASMIVTAMFAAASGAIIIESLGPLAALKRSLQLTKDYRFPIFWCSFLVGIIAGIVTGIFTLIGTLALLSLPQLMPILIAVAVTPLTSTLSAVVYHDLRATKEGVDLAELSRVFN